MKKIAFLFIGTTLSLSLQAQKMQTSLAPFAIDNAYNMNIPHSNSFGARTSAIGSIDTLVNVPISDTPVVYPVSATGDSGFISGMDNYGNMGFAERYDFNGADSSLQVTGILALFTGVVNPASTKTVNFYAWSVGPQVAAPFSGTTGNPSPVWFDSGLPDIALDSISVPITSLGVTGVIAYFTPTVQTFTTPTAYLNHSFFVGYTINYNPNAMGGDTIAVATTYFGDRTSPLYTVSGTDTIVNNQNATLYNPLYDDGFGSGWHDDGEDTWFAAYDFCIFPIVKVGAPLSVTGVTKNNLTFFGNYPNPATDITNIKFSLSGSTDVTITIMDMSGHTINTISEANLAVGINIIPVNTSCMASGDYLYLVHTAGSDGIAGKMTIVR